MASSDSDWRKMLRVISGGVGRDILKEEREKQKEEYPVDRSLLSIKDWETEFSFRNMINNRNLTERARRFLELAHARFRQRQMTSFMQQNQDSLSTWAVMDQGDPENNGNSFRDVMHFIWHFRYDLGAWKQGKLVEVIGPMRSGKNNFVVYVARAAMSGNIHVITSFPMFFPTTQDGILKDFYHESHSHVEAVLHMIRTRYAEPEAIFFLVLDEQTTRGASNMRPNTLEAEYANGWIVRSGHFGCTTIRLMQTGGDTIRMQKNLRYVEIYKKVEKIDQASGSFVSFGDDYPITFQKIPDMSKYFNTASPGSWTWDLNPQAMNDYMAIHEGECNGDTKKIYQFYERYLEILKKTDEPYWFRNDDFRRMDVDLKQLGEEEKRKSEAEAAARAAEEAEKNREPLPLHHEECPRVGGGHSYTWTPKRYYREGEDAMCPKCHGHFKVHYSTDAGTSSETSKETGIRNSDSNAPDLLSEGYRGSGHGEKSGRNSGGVTVGLNTPPEHLKGQSGQDPGVVPSIPSVDPNPGQDAGSQGDLSLDPGNDVDRISQDGSGKRTWTQTVPELIGKSKQLRHEAAQKRECASCGKPLAGSQVYYCSEGCKLEFYQTHPTSVRWNDLRLEALKRDNYRCLKCGNPAEEVDHIQEIWEGGPEFDLANLQSLCHECHVSKTNESRRRRNEQKAIEVKQ